MWNRRRTYLFLAALSLPLSSCVQVSDLRALQEPVPAPAPAPTSPVVLPSPTSTPDTGLPEPEPPSIVDAKAIFSDSFDDQADWSVPYTTYDQGCNKETGCTNHPRGYYGYYISRSVISPLTGHGLHLDSSNRRGASGKGLTYWDQTDGLGGWTSGMQLGFDFPAQKEVYVRYWIRMQPGYRYVRGAGMMRKLNHISHYLYNGRPFTFFSQGGFFPTTVNQLQNGNGGIANLSNIFFVRPDPSYSGAQLNPMPSINLGIQSPSRAGIYNYFDLPGDSLPIGNWGGTGTDYDSPGMFADGGWHCLEFYLRNNSAPGVADGKYKFWLDGVLQMDGGGYIYREAASVLPDAIWNFVHVGGNTINPFLGPGISGEQYYAVDDLVVSGHYSGPPPAPVNVTATSTESGAARLAWTAGTNQSSYLLSGYRVYYGSAPGALDQVVTLEAGLSAEIPGLVSGQRYYFQLTAVKKASYDANENESRRSPVVSVVVR